MNAKRTLLLRLRRGVKTHRRFDVVDLGDGRARLTCTTCNTSTEEMAGSRSKGPFGKEMASGRHLDGAKFLARWWSKNKRISGECAHCTKTERDRRYPLPKETIA